MKKKFYSLLLVSLLVFTFSTGSDVAATNSHPDNLVSSDTFSSVYDGGWFWNFKSQYHNLDENKSLFIDYIGVSSSNVDVDLVFYCEYDVGMYTSVGKVDLPDTGTTEVTPAMMSSAFTNGCRTHWRFEIEVDNDYYNGRSHIFDNAYEDSLYIGYTNPNLDITPPVVSGSTSIISDYDNLETEAQIRSSFSVVDETDGLLPVSVVTDNYTGQVTTLGAYTIDYTAADTAGNSVNFTVTINVVDVTDPVVSLNGEQTEYVEYLGTYSDPGATATDNYDSSVNVVTGGTVDTSSLGSNILTYTATDTSGNSNVITRSVVVRDTTKPTITLTGNAELFLEVDSTYSELGATVSDNYDDPAGPVQISGTVDMSTLGTYYVNYNYTDENGNVATTITRTVHVEDNAVPVITLTGDETIYIEFGDSYTEQGATVTDNHDNGLTATIGGSVNTGVLGTYNLTYNVQDSSGNNAAVVTRTVIVQDTTAPTLYVVTSFITYNSQYETLNDIITGYTASDIHDGNLTSSVELVDINYSSNMFKTGTYSAKVVITDSSGNSTEVTVTIDVQDDLPPSIEFNEDYFMTQEEFNAMTQEELKQYIEAREESRAS